MHLRHWMLICCLCLVGCQRSEEIVDDPDPGAEPPVAAPFDLQAAELQVRQFCGDCHAVPTPDQFPMLAWPEEIDQGYRFYYDSGRTDLKAPPRRMIMQYYVSQAPDGMQIEVYPSGDGGPVRFEQSRLAFPSERIPGGSTHPPAIANVNWGQIPNNPARLLVSEMRTGLVYQLQPAQGDGAESVFTAVQQFDHPCHTTMTDLDQDQKPDMLVADLGSFLPEDHQKGRVIWIRPGDDGTSESHVLLANVGRVTDVQTGDFDGDGDLDAVVAEFGWRNTGQIHLLENRGWKDGVPDFEARVLDKRHGCIQLPVVDLDQDGDLDFVAVISQEHEIVLAFLNRGDGSFRQQLIFAADNPSFGSSGVDVVDLDQDGDPDLLYTNGDVFDLFYIVPYHGVHWLENLGDGSWDHHQLTQLPGVHRAEAGDLDGDGDLDIVACSLVTDESRGDVQADQLDSLIWLEQTAPGTFLRHSLERARCTHATLEVGDFDGDGDQDLAVGEFRESAEPVRTDLTIWWNQLPAKE